jgi:uncharacterized membrane protein YgdD (TMEM256/DUF423 family)
MNVWTILIVSISLGLCIAFGAYGYQVNKRELEYRQVCNWWGGVPAYDGQKFQCFRPKATP